MKLTAIPIPMPIMVPTGASCDREISASQWWVLGAVVGSIALLVTGMIVWLSRK